MNYQHSMIQEQYLALEMSSSERLKPEERAPTQNNNKIKYEQLKLSKTYPQNGKLQWTTTMQGIRNDSTTMPKLVLWVNPYFHILASSLS
jgi:hypothetical protein